MNHKDQPNYNFFPVSHAIIESNQWLTLKPASKILYFILCKLRNRYADDGGHFWRSDRDLSNDSGLSLRTIKGAKQELKQKGLIRTKITTFTNNKMKKATIYRIIDYQSANFALWWCKNCTPIRKKK